jgi:peptidoglycan-N-acetylglucosamine deacetylase
MLKFNIISIIYLLTIVLSVLFIDNSYPIVAIILTLTFLYLVFTAWAVSNIGSQMFVKTYNSNPKLSSKVFITYDDGPDAENTPKLLEILRRNQAKASFFLIGENIVKHRQIADEIHSNGHAIGNHSYYHTGTFPIKLPGQIKLEIEKTQVELEKITGKRNVFFRPPFGITNHFISLALSKMEMKVIGWNIRSLDTTIKDKEKILKRITKNLKGGDVVLLHDKTKYVCWLTEEILKYLKQNNLETATIEELL